MDAQELFDGRLSERFIQYPDLKSRPVFICGGSSGLGAYLTAAFAAQGAPVGFLSNEPEKALHLCDAIEAELGFRPFYADVDVRDLSALSQAIARFSTDYGSVSVLINNAARDNRHTIDELSPDTWEYIMNTNLRSYAFSVQQVKAGMVRQGYGSILNLGSNAARIGMAGFPVYVASKAAIAGMSKALSRELGPSGIRVNTLSPGWVITERQRSLWYTPENHNECLGEQSIKRMMTGVDVANTALFLTSQCSSMITGQEIIIDGGRI